MRKNRVGGAVYDGDDGGGEEDFALQETEENKVKNVRV